MGLEVERVILIENSENSVNRMYYISIRFFCKCIFKSEFFSYKEKDELEKMLRKSQEVLEEQKSYIQQLRQQQKDEKRERAK